MLSNLEWRADSCVNVNRGKISLLTQSLVRFINKITYSYTYQCIEHIVILVCQVTELCIYFARYILFFTYQLFIMYIFVIIHLPLLLLFVCFVYVFIPVNSSVYLSRLPVFLYLAITTHEVLKIPCHFQSRHHVITISSTDTQEIVFEDR